MAMIYNEPINSDFFLQDFQTIAIMLSHGRNSPPPNFKNRNSEDSDDNELDGDEDEEDENPDEEDDADYEEKKSPIAVSLPPPPLKSCLKSTKKLTTGDSSIKEGV